MHAFVLGTFLLARVTGGSPASGLGTGGETPTAADLLRAKRMSDEASHRLELRQPKRGGWVRGGDGWEHGTGMPERTLPAERSVR